MILLIIRDNKGDIAEVRTAVQTYGEVEWREAWQDKMNYGLATVQYPHVVRESEA